MGKNAVSGAARKLLASFGLAAGLVGVGSASAGAQSIDPRISDACWDSIHWDGYVPRWTEEAAFWSPHCSWDEYGQVDFRLALGDNRMCPAWGEEWVEYEAWAARQVLYGLWTKENYAGAMRWAAERGVRMVPNGESCR